MQCYIETTKVSAYSILTLASATPPCFLSIFRLHCDFAERNDLFRLAFVKRAKHPAIASYFGFENLFSQPKRELLSVKVAAHPPAEGDQLHSSACFLNHFFASMSGPYHHSGDPLAFEVAFRILIEIANVDVHLRHLRWHGCWLNGIEITVFGARSFLNSSAHFIFRPLRVRYQLNGLDFIWQRQVQLELIGKLRSVRELSAVYEAGGVGIGGMKISSQRIRIVRVPQQSAAMRAWTMSPTRR